MDEKHFLYELKEYIHLSETKIQYFAEVVGLALDTVIVMFVSRRGGVTQPGKAKISQSFPVKIHDTCFC